MRQGESPLRTLVAGIACLLFLTAGACQVVALVGDLSDVAAQDLSRIGVALAVVAVPLLLLAIALPSSARGPGEGARRGRTGPARSPGSAMPTRRWRPASARSELPPGAYSPAGEPPSTL